MDLGKVNWKSSEKDSPLLMSLKTFTIHGKNQNIEVNRSLEEVDPNAHDDFEGVQDFSGGRKYRCGRNSKITRSGAWRWD